MDYFSSNLRRPCWQFFVGQLGWPPAIPPCVPGKGWSPQRLIWTGWVWEGLDVGQTWWTSENGVLLMRWWGFVRWTYQGPVYLVCTYKVWVWSWSGWVIKVQSWSGWVVEVRSWSGWVVEVQSWSIYVQWMDVIAYIPPLDWNHWRCPDSVELEQVEEVWVSLIQLQWEFKSWKSQTFNKSLIQAQFQNPFTTGR